MLMKHETLYFCIYKSRDFDQASWRRESTQASFQRQQANNNGLLHLISETGIAMVNWKGRISPITELLVAAAFTFDTASLHW